MSQKGNDMFARMIVIAIGGILAGTCAADAAAVSKPHAGKNVASSRQIARKKSPRAGAWRPSMRVIVSSRVDRKSGNLIAMWVRYRGDCGDGMETVVIPDRYAMFIKWARPEDDPQWATHRMFVFYDNVCKRSYQTRNYQAFLNVVAAQPENIEIRQVDGCLASLRCGMPNNERARLGKVLKAGNRRVINEPSALLETCGAVSYIYPADRNAPKEQAAGNRH